MAVARDDLARVQRVPRELSDRLLVDVGAVRLELGLWRDTRHVFFPLHFPPPAVRQGGAKPVGGRGKETSAQTKERMRGIN